MYGLLLCMKLKNVLFSERIQLSNNALREKAEIKQKYNHHYYLSMYSYK